MLIYKLIKSKKADSLQDIFIYCDTYLFLYSRLTNEYRFTDKRKWLENFSEATAINSLTVEDYKSDELNKMIEIGKRSNINNKIIPINDKEFQYLFNLQIKFFQNSYDEWYPWHNLCYHF